MTKINRSIHLAFLLLFILLVFGCTKPPDPIDVFKQYASDWEKNRFDTMWGHILPEESLPLEQEGFIQLYKTFYEDLAPQKMEVILQKEKLTSDEGKASVPFQVQLTLQEGVLTFDGVMEASMTSDKTWKILWSEALVWKDFTLGDRVHRAYEIPTRGEIHDRNGSPLAQNGTVLLIGIVPGRLGDSGDAMIAQLATTFNLTEQYIRDRMALPWVGPDTFVDLTKVPMNRLADIRGFFNRNPGITYREIKERVYPYGPAAAHLIGYLSYPTEGEMKERKPLGFTEDDKLGRTGLESSLNQRLEGIPGLNITLRDSEGKDKLLLLHKDPVQGETVTLNIDGALQKKLYQQMAGEAGMAAVLNHKTGEVLAMVSAPAYDPNEFILGMSSSAYKLLENDVQKPLFNRLSGVYSPGSTFKPITAASALESGAVDRNFSMNIQGKTWQKDSSWGSHRITRVSEVNGVIDMETAMIYSDNIYFANLALTIGKESFQNFASNLGIGRAMTLLYPMKTSQLSNENALNNEILLADTGYGQGQVLVNVLTLPMAYSALIHQGAMVEPLLLKESNQMPITHNVLSAETAVTIFDMLEKSVRLSHGTGYGAYIPGKMLAGKTGTAEIPSATSPSTLDELGWFVVLDSDETTPYATVMMLENVKGRGGSGLTVSKVKAFIQSYEP